MIMGLSVKQKLGNTYSNALRTFGKRQLQTVLLGASALFSALAAISPAQAAVVTSYTDRAAFTAAAGSLTNIDFEGLAAPGGFVSYGSSGVTLSGVNFVGSSNNIIVIDSANVPIFYDWGSGAVLRSGLRLTTITATLPSGIKAIGSDIFSFANYASPFAISLSTGDTFTFNSLNYPNRAFAGFISDTPISSISFQATNGFTLLDNFAFGQANVQPVPEPLTILGTVTAAGMGVAMRRKQKQQQKATTKVG